MITKTRALIAIKFAKAVHLLPLSGSAVFADSLNRQRLRSLLRLSAKGVFSHRLQRGNGCFLQAQN